MIGRLRAAWDEAGRLANHRRGTNPMTRDEWKSAEIRQGEILAHVEALGELGPDLLVAMKLQREFFDGLRKVLDGEGQVSDTLVLGESVALHGVVLSLLRVLAGCIETHGNSPSARDAGAHSVGEGEVAGVETAAPVTDATDAFAGPGLFRYDGMQARTAEHTAAADAATRQAMTRQIGDYLEELHRQGESWHQMARLILHAFELQQKP